MSTITMTNTDPGEGSALSSDNFVAVYGGKSILDMFYPVGSEFKCYDTTFNPNTAWGGTWVENEEYQLVAYAKTNGTTILASKNISSVVLNGSTYVWTLSKAVDTNSIIQATAEGPGAGMEIVGAYWSSSTVFRTDATDYTGNTRTDISNWFITIYGKLNTPEYKIWRRTA